MQTLIDKVVALSQGVAFKSTLSDGDKAAVEELYLNLLHKKLIRRTGCQDCYRDAIIEIKIHLKQRTMTYILKNGALIYDEQTNTHYTATNITDDVAERVLAKFPALADQFAHIPTKGAKIKVEPKTPTAAKGAESSNPKDDNEPK